MMFGAWNDGTGQRQGEPVGEHAGADLAAVLSDLKKRSGLSYGILARRTHFSTSTVHRYCSGAAVPPAFTSVDRLARVCGAQPRELIELHRLWLLADAERHRKPPSPEPAGHGVGREDEPGDTAGTTSPADQGGSAASSTPEDDRPVAPGGGPEGCVPGAAAAPTPPARNRARMRRWSLAAGLTGVLVVATLVVGAENRQDQAVGTGTGAADDAEPQPPAPDEPRAVPDGLPDGAPKPSESPAGPDEEDPHTPSEDPEEHPRPEPEEHDGEDGAGPAPATTPLHWSVRSHVWPGSGCRHTYLVDGEPTAVPAPPIQQDSEAWAGQLGAVQAGHTVVEATLRSAGDYPVVIEALHVRVKERGDPLPWNLYATNYACGGSIVPAAFAVDLDATQPQLVPTDGDDPDVAEPISPPRLPYQVTAEDPLALRVEAQTARCDCSWTVDVEWSSGPERGTVVLNDGGKPFRTSGTPNDDPYIHVSPRGGWMPESSY